VYQTFNQGTRVLRRATQERPHIDVELYFEKLEHDLRNVFAFEETFLSGDSEELKFMAMARPSREDLEKAAAFKLMPATIEYVYDAKRQSVIRKQGNYYNMNYPEGNKADLPERVLVEEVTEYSVDYYKHNKAFKSYGWQKSWGESCFPLAVRVNLTYGLEESKKIQQIIQLPMGGCA